MDINIRDNYRYGQKKKKRKRDKTDDPGESHTQLKLLLLALVGPFYFDYGPQCIWMDLNVWNARYPGKFHCAAMAFGAKFLFS